MRIWKEKYTLEKAISCGIHGNEGSSVTGNRGEKWTYPTNLKYRAKWIYYVEVCKFQFAFFSIEMLDMYIDFFSRKILPTSRFYGVSPFSDGPAASIGDGQSPFERLPSYLRKRNNRPKVLKALIKAKESFEKSA